MNMESSSDFLNVKNESLELLKNTKVENKNSEQMTLFKLLKEVYIQTIDSKATRMLWPFKTHALNVYFKVKERMIGSRTRANIYNSLVLIWLELNMPFKENFVKFSVFKSHFQSKIGAKEEYKEQTLSNFYNNAVSIWSSLVDPSFEEIKNACIFIVARTVVPTQYSEFGEILMNFFLILVNQHEELVSLEEFIYLLKNYEGLKWNNSEQWEDVCRDFYVFGKRFITVDFPLSSTGTHPSKLVQIYLKDKVSKGINKSLDYMEGSLDGYALKKYKVNLSSGPDAEKVKNIYVQRSLIFFSKLRQTKDLTVENVNFRIKNNRVVKALKIEQRYISTLALIDEGNSIIHKQIINPTSSLITFCFEKTKNSACVILRGFDVIRVDVQGRLCELLTKYKYLQDVTIKQFKNFIEIRIPMETLRYYGHEVKEELTSLYKEIKNLNIEKVQIFSQNMYKGALDHLKSPKKLSKTMIRVI